VGFFVREDFVVEFVLVDYGVIGIDILLIGGYSFIVGMRRLVVIDC